MDVCEYWQAVGIKNVVVEVVETVDIVGSATKSAGGIVIVTGDKVEAVGYAIEVVEDTV
jgi:hypothetical protein